MECVKQEPNSDFGDDLDQCVAAIEKDAVYNGGSTFSGFPDLIGEDTNDEIITSDAFNDLISDINFDFDFDDNKTGIAGTVAEHNAIANGALKMDDTKDLVQNNTIDGGGSAKQVQNSPLVHGQNYSPPVFEGQQGKNRMSYPNMDFAKTELSPAAQTLKQMAEQHQHKNQMGLQFNPNARVPNARSPYSDFQSFQGEYGSPNSNPGFKNSPGFPQPDMIKQEILYQGNEYDMKRKSAGKRLTCIYPHP